MSALLLRLAAADRMVHFWNPKVSRLSKPEAGPLKPAETAAAFSTSALATGSSKAAWRFASRPSPWWKNPESGDFQVVKTLTAPLTAAPPARVVEIKAR